MKKKIFFINLLISIFFITLLLPILTRAKINNKNNNNNNRNDLVQLIVLNRHGHRAPNTPYWDMCPNDAGNREQYDVVLSGALTGKGLREEADFGRYLRRAYGAFIGDTYDGRYHYVRAAAEPRTVQSAMIASESIFPDGFGPRGVSSANAQYVPIFSDLPTHEYLVEDTPCSPLSKAAAQRWMSTTGRAMLAEPQNRRALDELLALCGTTNETLRNNTMNVVVKVIVDGIIFNHDYGLRVLRGRLAPATFLTLRNLSNAILQGSLYGTDKQRTFGVVDFPHELLYLLSTAAARGPFAGDLDYTDWRASNRFSLFVGHREELYGMGHFFGLTFDVPHFPRGELPTASALLFGLYNTTAAAAAATFAVKVSLWTPLGVRTLALEQCAAPHLCTLEEFRAIYTARVERTGPWTELCNYKIPENDLN